MSHGDMDRFVSRRRLLTGTGAGLAATVAGCTGGGDGGDGSGDGSGDGNGGGGSDPTELPDVFFLTDYNNELWQARWEDDLIPAFEEETGIGASIEYSGMSGEQENRLATLLQSNDPPDINTSTFDQVADIWSNDQLTTVNEVVAAAEEVAGDLLAEPYREDGDIWQVPHGYYTSNFHYREDVYEELGLSVPTTFDQLVENARVIDESEREIRGYGLGGQKVGKSQDEFQVYLAHMGYSPIGLRWRDPDVRNELEIWFPEDVVTTLLEFFDTLSQYSPDPTAIGWASSIQNYLGGQYAQQYHLNVWLAGIAAAADIPGVAYNTGVAPLPYWEAGGASKGDSWLFEPTPDGHHVFAGGDNTPGAKEWLRWLYGDTIERAASMYRQEPTRFLPIYGDVIQSDPFQGFEFWQQGQNDKLLSQVERVQEVQVGEHYGQVPESDLNDPVALYVTRQWFYGEMVNRVVTGTDTIQEAYEWGRGRLETRLEEGRERFR